MEKRSSLFIFSISDEHKKFLNNVKKDFCWLSQVLYLRLRLGGANKSRVLAGRRKKFFFSICHQDFIPEKKKREEDRADPAEVEPELVSGEIVEFFLKTHRLPKTLHEDPQQSWKQITCWLSKMFENNNKLVRFIAKLLKCSIAAFTSIAVVQ
jgi:hypothetical protein